ncbi:MAG: acyl-CoA reductase, partial [Verrucomicrobiota bacterium]
MNLPDYFIADLPAEAVITPRMIAESCDSLRRNREQFLTHRSTDWMIGVLCHAAEQWLEPGFPLRKLALNHGPAATGFSSETLARGLDTFFRQFTQENFEALLRQDLGHLRCLDKPSAPNRDEQHARLSLARGPELILHFTAGNLPIPALMSMTLGLLTRSSQWVKCAAGGAFI